VEFLVFIVGGQSRAGWRFPDPMIMLPIVQAIHVGDPRAIASTRSDRCVLSRFDQR
jgi:hypothetical protein